MINWSFKFILNETKQKKVSKTEIAQKTFSPSIGYECCTQKYLTIKIDFFFFIYSKKLSFTVKDHLNIG